MSTTQAPAQQPGKFPPSWPPHTFEPPWWEDDWPHRQSRAAADLAALKAALPLCQDPPAPMEFPKLLYNAARRITKVAASKDDETKDTAEGFSETPFPADPANALQQSDKPQPAPAYVAPPPAKK